MINEPRISTQVRAGWDKLIELQEQIEAIPAHRFNGVDPDDDNAVAFDYKSATEMVLARLDEVPRATLACLIADLVFNREEQFKPEVANFIADQFAKIEDDKATTYESTRVQ